MAGLFRRSRGAAERPSAEAILDDILDLHAERPGITEATLGAFATEDGRTGYDLLVEALPVGARAVLELGCGNGPLIERLAARVPALERIVGVDLCEGDLRLACARVKDARVELLCEAAQAMSVGDASVDAAVSHHAFYLFDPIEPVIAELGRVIRPGGVFSFMTSSFADGGWPLFEAMMRVFGERNKRENPHFPGWGDRRVWRKDGLEELFFGEGGKGKGRFEGPLVIDEVVLFVEEPAGVLAERLMRFFYSVELQSEESQRALRGEWVGLLEAERGAGERARFAYPMARVTVKRGG